MTYRTSAVALVAALVTAASTQARADNQSCNDNYEKGQVLRKDTKLLEARDAFRTCVNACSAGVEQKDCVEWLAQTERDIPSVVISAKDRAGATLVDVAVAMDGSPLVAKLDGRSIEVNPGIHVFSFRRPDGTSVETQVVVEQGKKDTPVSTAFAQPEGPQEARGPATAPASEATGPPPSPGHDEDKPNPGGGQRMAAILVGVGGLGGAVLGTIYGLQSFSLWESSTSECSTSSCPNHALAVTNHDNAVSAATISTVGFIGAGALLVGGAALYFTAPTDAAKGGSAVRVLPSAGPGGGGVIAEGTF